MVYRNGNNKLLNSCASKLAISIFKQFRLTLELRERENIHLQLEEARANLRTSEDDRMECEDRIKELEKQKLEKEEQISDLKRTMDEERKNYLQNLK